MNRRIALPLLALASHIFILGSSVALAAPPENSIASAAKNALESLRTGVVSRVAVSDRILARGVETQDLVQSVPASAERTLDSFDVLAREIAAKVTVDKQDLLAAWTSTDPRRLQVVFTALAQVGTPYRFGGNMPGGFDCSGLTSFAWASVGIRIPRISSDQIEQAVPRELEQLRAGDLLWRPGHIGMSIGIPDVMVNATQTGRPVEVKRWGKLVRTGSPISD